MADDGGMRTTGETAMGGMLRLPPAPHVLHMRLASHVPNFINRHNELIALDATLARHGQVVLAGAPGLGKSALAQQYGWLNRGRFAGLWWIRAQTRETVTADLSSLGRRLLPDLAQSEDTALIAARVLDFIAARTDEPKVRPFVLVYDDANVPEVLDGLLPEEGASVIVTTRQAVWRGAAALHAIEPLSPDASLAYLLRGGDLRGTEPDSATHTAAGEIATALEHLPMALALAGGTMAAAGRSPVDYAAQLIEAAKACAGAADYGKPVEAAFALAMQHAESHCPDATRLMGLLAYWAPDEIPVSLVSDAVMSAEDRARAIAALAEVGLVTSGASESGGAVVSVSRAAQAVMRAKLGEIGQNEAASALALDLLADAAKDEAGQALLMPHILAASSRAPGSGDAAKQASGLLETAAIHFAGAGDLGGAEAALKHRLVMLEAKAGGEDAEGGAAIDEVKRSLGLVQEKRAEVARQSPPKLPRVKREKPKPVVARDPVTSPTIEALPRNAANADAAAGRDEDQRSETPTPARKRGLFARIFGWK